MNPFSLSQISPLLQGHWQGSDATFHFVSTDSRTIQAGELFIALVGPHFDGHHFIEAAKERGAAAAMISRPVSTSLPVLQVSDTRLGLGQLAKIRRGQTKIPVVGITGSCGKTTTKTMLASIMVQQKVTLATQGTLNNDIGVPLTLLRLTAQHEVAVIEMGANHHGEIAYVADIAQPTIGIITNAAPVHIEGFGDLAGVARGKGELYQALPEEGLAILNIDDEYAAFWRGLIGDRRCVTFGLSAAADVTATAIKMDEEGYPEFNLSTPEGQTTIRLSVLGQHNVHNALAAAAAAQQLGASLTDIKKGLESAEPVAKRSIKRVGYRGAKLIDDTYNANPTAFRAALALLAHTVGHKILVMGDMVELGEKTKSYHAEVGRDARRYGVQQLYAVGELSREAVHAFGENAYHFDNQQALIAAVREILTKEMTVLIKGSRSTKMENVVDGLL